MNDNIRIVDALTGEVVDRPMTDDEQARHDQNIADAETRAQAAAHAAAAKNSGRAKLKALGLTDDEIAALIP